MRNENQARGEQPERARKKTSERKKTVVGWKEVVRLPDFGDLTVHAKIDSGARTCALHVETMKILEKENRRWVEFSILPARDPAARLFQAPVVDKRTVKSSSGHAEERVVVKTPIRLAGHRNTVEITLTNRDSMEFPMLIGRNLLRRGFLVDSSHAYLSAADKRGENVSTGEKQ
ncbi:ATP-dependent zinc protease family protein [Oricola cellulosilytica]|uniref:ATP-dependent zinc protease n=1 Tax=Oricola cellulosilytica TaxID=1429082 RepID=A0A4R0PDC0_9HYPH|nr:RimK/LysX family protein [Oricola cellulosilytica]TCD14553.1 ATP-dependent zinc protease [Oricola cellulosilytica]